MQSDSGFYAPLQYSAGWFWAGLALVLLVALWYLWLLWPKRAGRMPPAGRLLPAQDLAMLRQRCLAAIDAVVSESGSGRLSQRAAHQRLSTLLRQFASDAGGPTATTMTLQELERHGPAGLSAAVSALYPAEFGVASRTDVGDSARLVRQVVSSWN